MATSAPSLSGTNEPKGKSQALRQESRAGWLMATPAVLLLLGFMIIPFLMAFVLSFTNQRLISPRSNRVCGAAQL